MPTHCPFCAAPLAPTGDAFCGECRGQLDEAPPAGTTPADLELRRRISTGGGADELTGFYVWICILFPLVGLIAGVVRVFEGKPSGAKMLLISGLMAVVQIILRLVIVLMLA